MSSYNNFSKQALVTSLEELMVELNHFKGQNLHIDLSRGKPCKEQLALCEGLLSCVSLIEDTISEDGIDCKNYGAIQGIAPARKLMGDLLEIAPENIIITGNSSLNMMFDCIANAFLFGVSENQAPWSTHERIKFLCPVPGYDRHFAICEKFGIQMLPIPMNQDGPDMDFIEQLVQTDATIKGIWCVPKYANPNGVTYSDSVVKRFANLKALASDFRIFWDNAYCIHTLEDSGDTLLNLFDECVKNNTQEQVYLFASTSKISFAGGGIAGFGASKNNIAWIQKYKEIQTLGADKINQLRHVRFFKDKPTILEHMKKHAHILKPKFDCVQSILEQSFAKDDGVVWSSPKGGYFISVDLAKNCATDTLKLCKELGVNFTPAGATFPYGVDPMDSNVRIAPSMLTIEELKTAMQCFCICAKITMIQNQLKKL